MPVRPAKPSVPLGAWGANPPPSVDDDSRRPFVGRMGKNNKLRGVAEE